tara:strand:+ start:70 stop:759 length:690 start_codon:yes stop_codon:yes gene_type:complete
MDSIKKVKSISIWIFLIPFVAVNICLYTSTFHPELFKSGEAIYGKIFPYIDGKASISRTARYFPNYLIFKPAMFLTAFFLIYYWRHNKKIFVNLDSSNKYIQKFYFFGVASAIFLILHSIFLGIKFDYELYKLFRRLVLLGFVIFEIVAQAILIYLLYKYKKLITEHIDPKFLLAKLILVSLLILVTFLSIPIISQPGNKFIKHALEWDYFLGVITFYLFTFFMWKKKN